MAVYGIANIANDAWFEQVVKRGWTDWAIPNVLRPDLDDRLGPDRARGGGALRGFGPGASEAAR